MSFLLQNNSLGSFIPPTPVAKCLSRLSLERRSSSDSAFHFEHLYTCVCVHRGNAVPAGTFAGRLVIPSFPAGLLQSVHHLSASTEKVGRGFVHGGVGVEGAPAFLGYRQECEGLGSCPTPGCSPAARVWRVLPRPQLLHTPQIKHQLTGSTAVSWRSLKNDFPAVRGLAIVLCLATFSTAGPLAAAPEGQDETNQSVHNRAAPATVPPPSTA